MTQTLSALSSRRTSSVVAELPSMSPFVAYCSTSSSSGHDWLPGTSSRNPPHSQPSSSRLTSRLSWSYRHPSYVRPVAFSPSDSEDSPQPSLPPSLREPPGSDLIPPTRPSLSEFRATEGAEARAAKLKAIWGQLPSLPELGDGPTPSQKMRLPGQDTMTALSPERADRLRQLYKEELVRRVKEKRPQARLWGGADDMEPEVREKGLAWSDFRQVLPYTKQVYTKLTIDEGASCGIKNESYGRSSRTWTGTGMDGLTLQRCVRPCRDQASTSTLPLLKIWSDFSLPALRWTVQGRAEAQRTSTSPFKSFETS